MFKYVLVCAEFRYEWYLEGPMANQIVKIWNDGMVQRLSPFTQIVVATMMKTTFANEVVCA